MRNRVAPRRNPYRLGSLRKGLELIDCFARGETWSLAELAQELGQTKATAFRILYTVEEFGYLHKDPATGRYSLATRFHILGSTAVRHEQLRWQALPPLRDLAGQTGETVHVGILYDGEAICVQAVDGTRLIRMYAFVGKRTPAHASALGKVLLAHAPDAELDAFVGRGLPRFTPRTITDPARPPSGAAPGPRPGLGTRR
jgi:DNA-binding IclR family transcriptional regulator